MEMKHMEHKTVFYVDQQEVGNIMYTANPVCIEHVIVHDAYQGKGYASQMMRLLVDDLHQQQTPFSCTCSYALSWMKKHKDDTHSSK